MNRSDAFRLRRPPKIRRVRGSLKLSLSISPNHKEVDDKTSRDMLYTMSTGDVAVRALL